jgi:hypothetical protein
MTQKRLQQAEVKYYKWAYIPSIYAGAGYNLNYLNPRFSNLYSNNLPNSYAGIYLSVPLFQGTKRTQDIRVAELQLTRLDWDVINLQNTISTQYAQALATYKSDLNNYYVQRDNLALRGMCSIRSSCSTGRRQSLSGPDHLGDGSQDGAGQLQRCVVPGAEQQAGCRKGIGKY